ncbi:hypothetical protein OGATHE_002726 [Ogataea polymorpha]|uniref:Uncharacterized protein n=1 Tax=Ogataea polymorpha TaxID=460523 RepID=A0A9P8PER5_9ASCO|nr:hypothetical protein OGATHE_002726 [Ogataea polymorpha]
MYLVANYLSLEGYETWSNYSIVQNLEETSSSFLTTPSHTTKAASLAIAVVIVPSTATITTLIVAGIIVSAPSISTLASHSTKSMTSLMSSTKSRAAMLSSQQSRNERT